MTTGLVKSRQTQQSILRCETTTADGGTATVKIQEGFASAIMSAASATDPDDRLVVTFTGIPEGLKVMVPDTEVGTRPQMIRMT